MSDLVITLLEGDLIIFDASKIIDVGGRNGESSTYNVAIRMLEGADDQKIKEAKEAWANLDRVYLLYQAYKHPGRLFGQFTNEIYSPVLSIRKLSENEGESGLVLTIDFLSVINKYD